MTDYMYRCVDTGGDWRGGDIESSVGGDYLADPDFYIIKYEIVGTTPKGFWIKVSEWNEEDRYSPTKRKRFVLADPYRKRFADVTVEKALHSYIKRKEVQRNIYTERAAQAERRLNQATTKYEATKGEG